MAAAAKEHLAKAEQALKPSWMSLKFSPDHLMASMEYSQELLHDPFGAGRAYESAAGICDGTGPGGPTAAMLHWEKAVHCFRLAGKADVAAKLLLKVAGVREKPGAQGLDRAWFSADLNVCTVPQGDLDGAKSAYEETINVFEQEEKDYELGDLYKSYIGFLIRREALEDTRPAIFAGQVRLSVVAALGKSADVLWHSMLMQELLSKIVLLVKMEDCVRAEEILTSTNVDGWIMSREYQVGTELVEATKNYDAEALIGLQKDQIFTFLQVEVARIAKLLKVATVAKPSDGDRGGYPVEKPPQDIADLLQWRRQADPPPRTYPPQGERRGDSRDVRSYSAEVPGGRPASKARPAEPPKRVALGQTSGVTAAGAWAARWEIADMLEEGCNVKELIETIRSGKEGHRVLEMGPSGTSGSLRSWSTVGSPSTLAPHREGGLWSEGSEDEKEWSKDLDKQKAIMESIMMNRSQEVTPPWASGASEGLASGSSTREAVPGSGAFVKASTEETFARKAKPPPSGVAAKLAIGVPVPPSPPRKGEREAAEEDQAFAKPAVPPPTSSPPPEGRRKGSRRRSRHRSRDRSRRRRRESTVVSMQQREKEELDKFHKECMEIYKQVKRLGVSMEMEEIVEKDGVLDEDRFRRLTTPNRAGTGLNYTRLMTRFLNWGQSQERIVGAGVPVDQLLGVLEFTEHLVQAECGYLTPRSFLYAMDFFGNALGFAPNGGRWNRAKRLAASYAASKTTPTSRAPGFVKATMIALEAAVLDGYLTKPERVACGKLRLCIQASTRFDDLLNTPLVCCEWVRKPGEKDILGLRSRATRGKSGPRMWIAAISGIDPKHDDWLPVLMKLLLEAHGATWKDDDHLGKAARSDGGYFLRSPATIGGDVSLVKDALEKLAKDGQDIGLTQSELEVLRWHGAKATLSSVMQHLGLKRKAVRFQGGWKDRSETMPDVYLREAQTLLLEAQQKCIRYLREGGDLVRLEEVPVDGTPSNDQAESNKDAEAKERARRNVAMATQELPSLLAARVPIDLLDRGFDAVGAIPEERLQYERTIFKEGDDWSECLIDLIDLEGESEVKKESEEDVPEPKPEKPDIGAKNPERAMDELDTEGLTAFWVQSKAPSSKPLVHLPAPQCLVKDTIVDPAPKCGVAGTFVAIQVEEALDPATTLCRRCCPSSSERACSGICSHMHLGEDVVVRRCTRRCHLAVSHEDHLCPLHDEPKAGGAE
eukprot:s2430_g11.t1